MGRVITNPTGSVVDASEVKILYESNEDTNAYTDGDKASLGEVKDAIDMAKKVVEITFLLNDWTSNSDGTYSQTVNNSEIKSSMNPDLISMLSSGATPEEQKAYMKNFSILCQGVGNTADGSVTYKIYKQMTGDITVGLTRLGGVRQIESEAKVDDVTVGGVSVVENKVAKIPAIPNADNLVPYEGATKDVDLGLNAVYASELITKYNPDNEATYQEGSFVSNGFGSNQMTQGEVTSSIEFLTDLDSSNLFRGLRVRLPLAATGKETLGHIRIADPTELDDSASKRYVDNKVAGIKIPIFHDDGVAGIDRGIIKPLTIPGHFSDVIPTEKITLQPGMKITGVLSTMVESSGTEHEGMIATVYDISKTMSSEGNPEIWFGVFVHNPFENTATIESITVKYSYVTF